MHTFYLFHLAVVHVFGSEVRHATRRNVHIAVHRLNSSLPDDINTRSLYSMLGSYVFCIIFQTYQRSPDIFNNYSLTCLANFPSVRLCLPGIFLQAISLRSRRASWLWRFAPSLDAWTLSAFEHAHPASSHLSGVWRQCHEATSPMATFRHNTNSTSNVMSLNYHVVGGSDVRTRAHNEIKWTLMNQTQR